MAAPSNPTTIPKVAFAWDLEEIGNFLDDVEKNPTKYCSNEAYNRPVTDGHPGTVPRIHVVAAAQFIKTCAFGKEPHIFNANLAGIGIEFEGCPLPDNTVFDVLGWLLSVCSEPPANATDRDYYLPLLALFARWCRVLGRDIEYTPPMVHISWFKSKSGKMLVLLGSTIGLVDTPIRQGAVERERQEELIAAKFKPQDGQLVKTDKYILRTGKIVNELFKVNPLPEGQVEWVKSGQGFGLCAETFFYLLARYLGKSIINEKTVKGLALRPRLLGKRVSAFQSLTKYDEVAAAENLADPCSVSCQHLIPQLGTLDGDQEWKWENIFGVSKLQNEIKPGSSQAAKAPAKAASGSGSAAAQPVPVAGGSKAKAKPSLKGELGQVLATTLPALMKT